MSVEERKAYVQAKEKERTEIQQKIQQLNEQRKQHVSAEMKKLHGEDNTLGSAIIMAVREQAVKKNFEFKAPEKQKPENSDTETDTQ
jgi:hypothetical protein